MGYNSFKQHKRGVENVIDFQSKAYEFEITYYFHWGIKTTSYKNNKFVCISIKHCWYWPVILNLVLIHIKKKNKFIIHSHNPLFSLFSVVKSDVFTVHDGLYYLNKSKGNNYNFLFLIMEKLLYFRCSLVHFISNYSKEQSLFGKRKDFVIIPNTSHFEIEIPISVLQLISKNNKKSILIVRSLEERARFDLLLQVAELLMEKGFFFTVAGKGPLLEYYQLEIIKRKISNLNMLGYVNDDMLLTLYSDCDIVLNIAEYGEGFGLPIIEGYLFNKPVIASNKCAIPEVIISANYLFENTVADIIRVLTTVTKNGNENYREYYNLNYSNTIVLSKFRKLYMNSLT